MKKMFLLVIAILLILSCNGGGGGGDNGTPPEIDALKLYKRDAGGDYVEAYVFEIGDLANLEVYAYDPDLDMDTGYFAQYFAPDFTTPYYPESVQALPSQADENMIYYLLEDVEIEGPAGNWRVCVYIVDKKGNESNEFCVNTFTNP